jgi:hypothetical protein
MRAALRHEEGADPRAPRVSSFTLVVEGDTVGEDGERRTVRSGFTATRVGSRPMMLPELRVATAPHPRGLRIAYSHETPDGRLLGGDLTAYPRAPQTTEAAAAERERMLDGMAAAATGALEAARAARAAGPPPDSAAAARVHEQAAAAAAVACLRGELEPPPLTDEDARALTFLQGYTRALLELGAALQQAEPEEKKPAKRGRPRRLPAAVPQQTWPEFEAVVFGVVRDGKAAGVKWIETPGEVALTHRNPGSDLSLKLGASTIDDPQKDYAPLIATSYEDLRGLLATHAGQCTAYLFNYTVARASEKAGRVTLSVDELVDVSGPRPRSEAAHRQRRREVWEGLRLFAHIAVHGRRESYANAGEMLRTTGPLVAFTERADEGQLSLDGSEPPREVTYVAGPWLERLAAADPGLLPYFRDVLALARQSDKRASYVWKNAVAWALGQRLRVNAKDAKEKRQGMDAAGKGKLSKLQARDFTRRELLDYLNPEPHYAEVLAGAHPLRAVALWDTVVGLLRQEQAGIIGAAAGDYVEHGPAPWRKPKDWPKGKPFKPQGWGDAWLDEPLTMRPGPAGQAAMQDVKTRAAKAGPKRRKRPAN